MRMNKEAAQRILSDVNPDNSFWVNNGPVLKNMEELYGALSSMTKDIYICHVNKEKNDFSNWIKDILHDDKLANDLLKTRSKEYAAKKVNQRLKYLKKIAA